MDNLSSTHKLIFANLNLNDSKVFQFRVKIFHSLIFFNFFTCKISGIDLFFGDIILLPPGHPTRPSLILWPLYSLMVSHAFILLAFTYLVKILISLLRICMYLLVLILSQSIFIWSSLQYIVLCDASKPNPDILRCRTISEGFFKAVRQDLTCPHPKEQSSHQLLGTCLASAVSLHSHYNNLSSHTDSGTNVLATTT